MEYAINERKNLLTGKKLGLDERDPAEFTSYEEFKGAFPRQLANLYRHRKTPRTRHWSAAFFGVYLEGSGIL